MDASTVFTAAGAQQFLLAFTRIGSLFLPLGLPNATQWPVAARVGLAALVTFALWPQWLAPVPSPAPEPGWAFLSELTFGALAGLAASAVLEALFCALQMIGLQSGYQYASTVDPTSQADSPVLPVLGQLLGFSLFFALGGDHLLIRALARSFRLWPPGSIPAGALGVEAATRIGATILETALGFALPLVALLVLVDLALGVVTRAHAQLQLISIAFPVKMLLSLVLLGALLPAWTNLFSRRLGALELALGNLLPAG